MVNDRQSKIQKAIDFIDEYFYFMIGSEEVAAYLKSNDTILLSITSCLSKQHELSTDVLDKWFQGKKTSNISDSVQMLQLIMFEIASFKERQEMVVADLIATILIPRVTALVQYREKILVRIMETGLQRMLPQELQIAINNIKYPKVQQLFSELSVRILMRYLSEKNRLDELEALTKLMDDPSKNKDFGEILNKSLEKIKTIPPLTFDARQSLATSTEKSQLDTFYRMMSDSKIVEAINGCKHSTLLRVLCAYYVENFERIPLNKFREIISNLDYLATYERSTFLLLASPLKTDEKHKFLIDGSRKNRPSFFELEQSYPVGAMQFLYIENGRYLSTTTQNFGQRLEGLQNKTSETDRKLWETARTAMIESTERTEVYFGLKQFGPGSLQLSAAVKMINGLRAFKELESTFKLDPPSEIAKTIVEKLNALQELLGRNEVSHTFSKLHI